MNIIFLDMDGVLNNTKTMQEWKEKFKDFPNLNNDEFKKRYTVDGKYMYIIPELMKRFINLYNKIPNCKIVWSSSWRRNVGRDSKLFVESHFYSCGFPPESFLGYTPNEPWADRSEEILDWLRCFSKNYQIEKIAIIDDREDADPLSYRFEGKPLRFFKTTLYEGLTEKIANDILIYFLEK